MPLWYYHVDVSDIFYNNDFTIVSKAHAIAGRIRLSDWYKTEAGTNHLEYLCEDLEDITSIEEFDEVWEEIYDLADLDRAWINVISDHQNETPSLVTRDHE